MAIRQKIGQTTDLTKTAFDGSSGSGISKLWDVVQDIETMTHVTAANIAPKRGKRPGDSLSKAITCDAARQYKLMFSTFPSLTESGWFAVWLSDLGGKAGTPLQCKTGGNGPGALAGLSRPSGQGARLGRQHPRKWPQIIYLRGWLVYSGSQTMHGPHLMRLDAVH